MMATLTITLYLTVVLAAYQDVVADSKKEQKNKGKSLIMECKTTDGQKDNFKLFANVPSKHIVVVYDKQTNNYTISKEYKERVTIKGPFDKITMELKDLQLGDSGLYVGQYSNFNLQKNVEEEEEVCAILLHVNEEKIAPTEKVTGKDSSVLSEAQILIFALTACTLVIVFGLMMWVCLPKVKARCKSEEDGSPREYNPVYEDMHRVRK
ncbi:uncharacterized protein Hap1MRO34_018512 [Clarias gariepinus]|uniref:uncharacterized protein LOC128544848 isoform X1 n=1 Tax=Clarias gariepinus TaxID=13013 RepID=UPI00234C2C9A|nr:uncharacterized protein LOC128544848 isoform X1 [Clarias gariepinus]